MAQQAKKIALVSASAANSDSIQRRIDKRNSQELVIALSGPIGCNIPQVSKILEAICIQAGYKACKIKISALMKEAILDWRDNQKIPLPEGLEVSSSELNGFARYKYFQDWGDAFRGSFEADIFAQMAIREIVINRTKQAKPNFEKFQHEAGNQSLELAEYVSEHYIPEKTVYIIEQLKHPSEVKLLRKIYGDIFFLLGTLCSETNRKRNLSDENIAESDAASLMERDKRENEKHGQQLEKTLELADYFIRNSEENKTILENQILRFIKLIHNEELITPTQDEYGMYQAYSASLKSACLSRQVGAAISDTSGTILSTGCNDVPTFEGGLYTAESLEDLRCYNKGGKCYNDFEKKQLLGNIKAILQTANIQNPDRIANQIFENTRIKDLIEFSRAIHAEMDAITKLARSSNSSTKNCTLYSTTYPCHNCARHIVAAGIVKVVYIEPYEKSLALKLHGDAITSDESNLKKVRFIPFEGVAPRRYQDFFMARGDRKRNGEYIGRRNYELDQKLPHYLDSYRGMEAKVYQHLEQEGPTGESTAI